MEDFLHRTITLESAFTPLDNDGNDIKIEIKRTRTSNNFRSITATVGKQKIEFNSDLFGDNYEAAASAFRESLEVICDDACLLPEFKK